MNLPRLALLFVVFIDVMGQGLIFPIVNTMIMDPSQAFLPQNTPRAARSFDYGLVIGVFFLFWFLGAAFIAKASDYIGRRNGILICLAGTLSGYVLTIFALFTSSYILLLLGRAIAGFTSGNQPIAQAALVDVSRNEDEKSRNLGLIVAASALGLVGGPLIAGILSDRSLLGDVASLELPFYCAIALVIANMTLIFAFFREPGFQRRKIDFGLSEVFLTLWRASQRPAVLRLSLVMFFGLMELNAFYIFLDTYLFARFKFDTLENSLALTVFGLFMAFGSAFLTAPLNRRFSKIWTVFATVAVMGVVVLAFVLNPVADLSYLLIVPMVICFGIFYPTMLALFSASVGAAEQGWVLGVTVALYSLGTGLIAVTGGALMAIDIRLPMYVSIACGVITLVLILTLCRDDSIRELDTPAAG